jgi:hypothetical protein
MPWSFCQLCETQLDEDTHTCPACGWDPHTPPPAPDPEPQLSLTERYRGTDYASSMVPALALDPRPSSRVGKARVALIVAFLAVIGLYGTMMAYTMFQPTGDRPAVVGVQR